MILTLLYTLLQLACLQWNAHWGATTCYTHTPVPAAPTIKITTPRKKETAPVKIGSLDKNTALMQVSFDNLPGWDTADANKSLAAFQNSCTTFLKQNPKNSVGSSRIQLKAGDWGPACTAALQIHDNSEETARNFFEKWFNPIEFKEKKLSRGLFTGYYMPQLDGSLTRTTEFTTPLYGLPKSLRFKSRHHNYYTREQIDNGVLKKKAPVIAWIKDPVDRLFLEIEGSGVIQLDSGEKVYVNYAGENGAKYTSIGSVLIKSGVLSKDTASKKAIIRYLKEHPAKVNPILHKNKSFVFFQKVKQPVALGAQGTALTPGYSLAIDKKWIPLGAPLWLNSSKPNAMAKEQQFQRLMIAQDTGGAIKGLMRADVYWGEGARATYLGENMKNAGHFWMLLPKYALSRLANKIGVI